jgi:hypothetical protein
MDPGGYILIAGQGRSGTNWLLEILDQSRQTHCRNEPNECAGSALAALPTGLGCRPGLGAELESAWDAAIARASRSFGERDHTIPAAKDHFSRLAQRTGLVRLARSKRLRKGLNSVRRTRLAEEWPIPSWVRSRRGWDQRVPVLKLTVVPGWIVWALENRPEARVLHIVRHPGGFLNSYIKRWLSYQADQEEVARANRNVLVQIVAHEPEWAERFGDIAAMSLLESELWYWVYCAETIHRAGEGNPRYQLVNYLDLARDPVEVSRALYRGCGLDWDNAIEQAIRRSSQESESIASAWRRALDAEQIALVERILAKSTMGTWWNEDRSGSTARALP